MIIELVYHGKTISSLLSQLIAFIFVKDDSVHPKLLEIKDSLKHFP